MDRLKDLSSFRLQAESISAHRCQDFPTLSERVDLYPVLSRLSRLLIVLSIPTLDGQSSATSTAGFGSKLLSGDGSQQQVLQHNP